MSNNIILYDLPSVHKGHDKPTCFSLNPWKSTFIWRSPTFSGIADTSKHE